jgi:hypothetical protein
MTTSRPERPSLPAQKVGAPIASPSAGQIVREGRAREIKKGAAEKEVDETMNDPKPIYYDPRRIYFELQHVLAIAVPQSAEKVLDDFLNVLNTNEVPEVTRRLMLEAIKSSMKKLKAVEEKLSKLERKLSEVEKR